MQRCPAISLLVLAVLASADFSQADSKARLELLKQKQQRSQLAALNDSPLRLLAKVPDVHKLHTGASYVNYIPYVASENNQRTNLGLNNFSLRSLMKGTNPTAEVVVLFIDSTGNIAGSKLYTVGPNELVQVNDVISTFGVSAQAGWLVIFSDEPITAWASVISNATNDPSIEYAIPWQLGKPPSYIEGQAYGAAGQRLLIASSVKSGTFQSTLVVVNAGIAGGNFTIRIYDNAGQVIDTRTAFIAEDGMFIDPDIRSRVSGTFGQIIIEPGSNSQRLMAVSLVRSSSGNGAFFPAYTLPPADNTALAGIWEGSLTGGTMNAQAKLTLIQERSMLYGLLEITSGTFPTTDKTFLVSGNGNRGLEAVLQIENFADGDAALSFISFRMFGSLSSGNRLEGDTLYTDEQKRQNFGQFSFSRTRHVLGP